MMSRFFVDERVERVKWSKDEPEADHVAFAVTERASGLVVRWMASRPGADAECARFEREGY